MKLDLRWGGIDDVRQQVTQLTAACCTADDVERVSVLLHLYVSLCDSFTACVYRSQIRDGWDAFNKDLRKFGGSRYAAKLTHMERQSRFMATLARLLLPDEYTALTKSIEIGRAHV